MAGQQKWQRPFFKECPRQDSFGSGCPATACRSLHAAQKPAWLSSSPSMDNWTHAPRRWWQEATRRLTQEGWVPHDLDPCLFALHHNKDDNTSEPRGLIALHVDDMLGAGDRSCPTYIAAERRLKEVFDFRSWQEDSETMEYCGVLHHRENFAWTCLRNTSSRRSNQ